MGRTSTAHRAWVRRQSTGQWGGVQGRMDQTRKRWVYTGVMLMVLGVLGLVAMVLTTK